MKTERRYEKRQNFVHELLHGLGWSLNCKNRWNSIAFGVMWSSLTPYCHCKKPLSFSSYSMGLYLPFCILGLGLFAVSMIIPYYLLKHKNGLILDHPTDCGLISFGK